MRPTRAGAERHPLWRVSAAIWVANDAWLKSAALLSRIATGNHDESKAGATAEAGEPGAIQTGNTAA
jgi:hypothetical protein